MVTCKIKQKVIIIIIIVIIMVIIILILIIIIIRPQYIFQPVSVENLGPFSSSTLDFLRDLGRMQNLSHFRRWQRGSVPLSKNLDHDPTF